MVGLTRVIVERSKDAYDQPDPVAPDLVVADSYNITLARVSVKYGFTPEIYCITSCDI